MQTTSTSTRSPARNKAAVLNPAAATKAAANTSTATKRSKAVATNFYVAALKEATGFHKSSFHIEMAVCLAFYTEQEKADLNAKKGLRPIYEKAGYDCKAPTGDDYKTVQRRISTAADLFTHLGGHETIYDWMDREQGARGIAVLVKELEKRKLDNISVVKAQAGKPQTRAYVKRAPEPETPEPSEADKALANEIAAVGTGLPAAAPAGPQLRRAVDQLPPERVLRTNHIVCAIPMDATQDEMKELALKLLAFAATAPMVAPVAPTGVEAQK